MIWSTVRKHTKMARKPVTIPPLTWLRLGFGLVRVRVWVRVRLTLALTLTLRWRGSP